MLQLTIRLGGGNVAIVQTIERPMANVTVIAMGTTVHLVIVTAVTNVLIVIIMIPIANQLPDVKSLIPMANLAVIAMGVTAHQVIVTLVTNMVSGKPTIEK